MDATSMYETANLIAAVETLNKPELFFFDRYFSERKTHGTEKVIVDVRHSARTIAPFTSPEHQGRTVERGGFSSAAYTPGYLKPKRVSRAHEHFKRRFGEQLMGGKTPAERAAEELVEDLSDLQDQIYRRKEVMCREVLRLGKVTIVGDGFDTVLDFERDAALTKSLDTKWSGGSSGDPIADIATYCRLVKQKSGRIVRDVIFGASSADAFVDHTKVRQQLDTRRVDLGQIDPRTLPKGVEYLGTLKRPNVDLWTYTDWFVDPSTGVETPMVEDKEVLLVAPDAERAFHYGAIKDFDAGLAEMPIFPKSWVEPDPSARFLMLQSAPLPVPYVVNGSALLTVLS